MYIIRGTNNLGDPKNTLGCFLRKNAGPGTVKRPVNMLQYACGSDDPSALYKGIFFRGHVAMKTEKNSATELNLANGPREPPFEFSETDSSQPRGYYAGARPRCVQYTRDVFHDSSSLNAGTFPHESFAGEEVHVSWMWE